MNARPQDARSSVKESVRVGVVLRAAVHIAVRLRQAKARLVGPRARRVVVHEVVEMLELNTGPIRPERIVSEIGNGLSTDGAVVVDTLQASVW